MSPPRPVPTNSFMKAVDVLRRYMKSKNCGLNDGAVYVKIPESKYAYVFRQSVDDYIHDVLGEAELANEIATHTDQLIRRLSHPCCRLITPIVFDYNYIEVCLSATLDSSQKLLPYFF